MKKILPFLITIFIFYGCLEDENDDQSFEITAIDSFVVPDAFTFGERDTIKIKYTLQQSCQYFNNIYYEYQDTARIVAISAVRLLDRSCNEESSEQYEYDLIVNALQEEDYVFKFYKGKDDNGENIFEEAVVPVN